MTSAAVIGSPLEKCAPWRRWNVYFRPSDEMSGKAVARSGTSWSWSSNRYRPEKTLRRMSTSIGAVIWAGSKSETSWAMGKLRVWSAARTSVGVDELPIVHDEAPIRTVSARERAWRRLSSAEPPSARRLHHALKMARGRSVGTSYSIDDAPA